MTLSQDYKLCSAQKIGDKTLDPSGRSLIQKEVDSSVKFLGATQGVVLGPEVCLINHLKQANFVKY